MKQFRSNTEIDKDEFMRIYKFYEDEYKHLNQKHIANSTSKDIENNLRIIKGNVKTILSGFESFSKILISDEIRIKLARILANIFVYWSLSKSGACYY